MIYGEETSNKHPIKVLSFPPMIFAPDGPCGFLTALCHVDMRVT